MVYSLLRVLASWVLRVYFRRIFIDGEEHIPSQQGALLVSNHPNAFLEACLMACFQPHSLYFLVRGDIFEHSTAKRFLRATHQIPIYRFRDGFSNLKRNASSFRESYKVLARGDKLLIFGEASTKFIRRLRPLQRGPARILQGVSKRYPDQRYYVVPTAVFFSRPEDLRSIVSIRFGPPMDVSQWMPIRNDNDVLDQITSEIEAQLREEMIDIPDEYWDERMKFLLVVLQNQMEGWEPGHKVVRDELATSDMKNKVEEFMRTGEQSTPWVKVEDYRSLLEALSIDDRTVQIGSSDSPSYLLESILGWPFFALGKGCNYPPLFLANIFSNNSAPKREFVASMKLAFLLLLYPVYFIILILAAAVLFGYWAVLIIVLPVLGAYALRYEDVLRNVRSNRRWRAIPLEMRHRCRQLRYDILNMKKVQDSDE